MYLHCSKCDKGLGSLENYGSDTLPLCFSCSQAKETEEKTEPKPIVEKQDNKNEKLIDEDKKLITIATFDWLNDAEFACMLLENNGIKSNVIDSSITLANPLLANAVGGIKLQVYEEDVDKAIAILKEDEKQKKDNYKPWCPNCESENVVKKELNGFLKVLSVLTVGLVSVILAKSFYCKDCGYKWR